MASAYSVACIQSVIRHVAGPDDAKKVIRENVNRIIANIEYTVRRAGRPRLVVLPEFALTGFDPERSVDDWVKICPQIPGEETAALGDVAAEHNLFICCGTMEFDPDWPGRWFNSAFIVGPDKSIVLRYRMHHAANVGGIGNCTSVGDVYTDYVKRYGQDSLFPVADTEIGKLAIVIGNDMAHPELVRAMVPTGAEVLCRPSSSFWGGLPEPTEALRRGRSFENQVIQAVASQGVYLSSLDDGRYLDDGFPLFSELRECDVVPMARGAGRSGV